MKEQLYRKLIELSNGKMSSNLLKKFSSAKISKGFIPTYIKVYGINTKEVSQDVKKYESLHHFFIRTLKEEVRPIDKRTNVFASPVDAKIESFGAIQKNMTFIVKDKPYSLNDLLGNEEYAKKYEGGQFIVFYLSPADYHRMHCPYTGTVTKQYVLGQKSYPVNQLGLTYGCNPLSHNYRMVSEVNYGDKCYSFIKVGAMFVNSIELTNCTTEWVKGDEVGYFSFGSTVVMLFEKDAVQFNENVKQGVPIKVGEAFATMV